MNFTRGFTSVVLGVVLTATAVHAQLWQGSADFPAAANGRQDLDITINNADANDSSAGTIDKVNVQKANCPSRRTRGADGDVKIFADCAMTNKFGTPWGLPRNQAVADQGQISGATELSNSSPSSAGAYRQI